MDGGSLSRAFYFKGNQTMFIFLGTIFFFVSLPFCVLLTMEHYENKRAEQKKIELQKKINDVINQLQKGKSHEI
jgi:TRAP-type mannitol/chloroaromatic compound transport system permease small subunit